MSLQEGVRSDPTDIETDPGVRPRLFDLAKQAQDARDDVVRSSRAHDRAWSDAERFEGETGVHERRCKQLTEEAIRRVLESCRVGEVDMDSWYYRLRPIASMRDGSTLLVVVPSPEQNWPRDVVGVDLAPFCSLVVVDDPNEESTAPEPGPESEPDSDRVPPPAPGILRDVVLRCIGWWESARTAAMIHKTGPDFDANDDDLKAVYHAYRLAERVAREAEALLGTAILHCVLGRPATLANTEFHLEALRPVAVEFAGITYTVVADPHEAINNDSGPGIVVPIVARVESGRVVAIG